MPASPVTGPEDIVCVEYLIGDDDEMVLPRWDGYPETSASGGFGFEPRCELLSIAIAGPRLSSATPTEASRHAAMRLATERHARQSRQALGRSR